eukprot:g12895.t1
MRSGWGDFETCKVYIEIIGRQSSLAEYEVLFLQPSDGIVVALEEAQDGHVVQGVRGGVEVARDGKGVVTNRALVLHNVVSKPSLGFPDVEEATSGTADT